MDTMLGIGRRIAPVTYRGVVDGPKRRRIVSDVEFADMPPARQRVVLDLASHFGVARQDVLDRLRYWIARLRRSKKNWEDVTQAWSTSAVPELVPRPKQRRGRLERPVLPPRREGDARLRGGRYWHPPRPSIEEIKLGYMRHVPLHARR